MSSDPAARIYPLIPSDPSPSGQAEQQLNNLATLETARQSGQQQLSLRLEQLVGQLQARGDDVELQDDTLEPITEAITALAVDLGMRGEDLEGALGQIETRVAQLDAARLALIAQTEGLASKTEDLRADQGKLSTLLGRLTDRLNENANRQQAVLKRLQDRTVLLDQVDEDLGQEIEGERQRLNDLDPRVAQLEKEGARLESEGREAAGKSRRLGLFIRRLAWSTGIFAALAVIGLGLLGYYSALNDQKTENILSTVGMQQQQLDSLPGSFDSLGQEMTEIASSLDSLYQVMNEGDAILGRRIDDVSNGMALVSAQLAEIQQRLDAPKEPLSSGAFDLSGVNNDEWLLKQAPDNYTVQVVGVYGKNAMANFIGRYRQQLDLEQIAVVHTLRRGRDWFVLLQGGYASAADATVAAEALPAVLQKNGPYVRAFDPLQEQVRYRQGLQAQ